MAVTADPCPCCGHEPEDYGHAEMMAWFEEQERLGNIVKVALFTSGGQPLPPPSGPS